MWNHAKKSMKHLKRPTSLISHWLPVEMVHNGPKLCKRKRVATRCKIFQEVSRYAIWKLTSWRFRKCGVFLFYNFLNPSYSCPKSGQISIFFFGKIAVSKKIDTATILRFRSNPPERSFKIGFRNFSREDLAWIFFLCAYFFFLTPHNFDDKLKISDSVDFEQP